MIGQGLGVHFSDEIHKPYALDGGDTSVVLLHGFPGTPAETLGLGKRLHAEGFSTRGVLLPGFGPEIDGLFDRVQADWIGAAIKAVEKERQTHKKVILFGYSFGAAVALHVARETPVDALILTAPFWRIGGRRERIIWRILRPFFPWFRPFRKINFNQPQIREGLSNMLPGLDLDDESAQAALRALKVPAGMFEEVMGLGALARVCACEVRAPVLIVQGLQDSVIAPAFSRELAAAFDPPAEYREVMADHRLIDPASPSFKEVAGEIIAFIKSTGG